MQSQSHSNTKGRSRKSKLWDWYYTHCKSLLVVPFLLLIVSVAYLSYLGATTGAIIPRDVSLKGGITLTIPLDSEVSLNTLQSQLQQDFPDNDIAIRELSGVGRFVGIVVEADISTDEETVSSFIDQVSTRLGIDLSSVDYGLETVGSTLGDSFFRESVSALGLAFLFMGIVIFIYFRNVIPSLAVILAAASDIVVTLAIVNVLGMKMGTAGLAAFLMLIGYSVDTDVLLTVRVLKRKEGSVEDRVKSSVKTGMTMTLTGLAAMLIALLVTQSEIIRQIMVILVIGLAIDIINTWIQNVGILRLYLDYKQKKAHRGK